MSNREPGCPQAQRIHAHRRRVLTAALATGAGWAAGCTAEPTVPLRIGSQVWPGYELMFLARQRHYLPERLVRLIEMPSASASLRTLASGAMEGAALTLDEVLTARSRGIDLVVVAVLDVSMGADVVMASPAIREGAELRGKRIGVEPGATGAVMLDALLAARRLRLDEVQVVPLSVDQHVQAYQRREVDAVVTYEPSRTLLRNAGAHSVFSSADVPGRIMDVLAVRREAVAGAEAGLRALVAGHFHALADWQRDPASCAAELATRLKVDPTSVPSVFLDLKLPGVAENRGWLSLGESGPLLKNARVLANVMQSARLLPAGTASLDDLFDARFLPE